MTTILSADGLFKSYPVSTGMFGKRQSLRAVSGVSLSVRPGETLGIVGESGCGKSTLARMLLGIEAPSAGEVLLDGASLGGFSRKEIAARVQPVFQDPFSSLNPRKTIGSIISLPLRLHTRDSAGERRRRVDEIMALVGLPPRLHGAFPDQLSGGQRQRAAIARALILKPALVVCDEPTSALDVSVQAQILNLLQDLRAELNLTYVLISHNLSVIEHMATRVAVMYLGRIVEEAGREDLFSRPRHPYTKALLASVLTPEPGVGIPDTQLGAAFPNPLDPPSGCAFHPRCSAVMDICSATPPRPLPSPDGGRVECFLYEDPSRGGYPASASRDAAIAVANPEAMRARPDRTPAAG